jgi:predicted nucleotidyltransferase
MIGISADFDPVHKGHAKLIQKGREISEETGDEVVIYMNKGYSANHAPFFTDFESRKEMALKAGADRVVPIEGLHHRLTLAYSVPIRIAMMIEDGVVDYVDATGVNVPIQLIVKQAKKFANKGIFSGIPRHLPNRNVIRWFAVNEFLYKKYQRKMKFHFIEEVSMGGKVSGREIRKSIIENDMEIPESAKEALPKTSVKILERAIKAGKIPSNRDWDTITHRMNKYSRTKLMDFAHLNADAINNIIKWRNYYDEHSVWATFRKAGYGPVLTRLAISAIEQGVTKQEVTDLIKYYEKQGIIPPDQTVSNTINRAWYVSRKSEHGMNVSQAHAKFRKGVQLTSNAELSFDGGLSIRNFEVDKLESGMNAGIYVDKNGKLACEIRTNTGKIKSPLKLPAEYATYLRLLLDSQFIPISASVVERERGLRINIQVHE